MALETVEDEGIDAAKELVEEEIDMMRRMLAPEF
jgi:hypothetical protein